MGNQQWAELTALSSYFLEYRMDTRRHISLTTFSNMIPSQYFNTFPGLTCASVTHRELRLPAFAFVNEITTEDI